MNGNLINRKLILGLLLISLSGTAACAGTVNAGNKDNYKKTPIDSQASFSSQKDNKDINGFDNNAVSYEKTSSTNKPGTAKFDIYEYMTGTWMNAEYLDRVVKTKSVNFSLSSFDMLMMFYKENKSYQFTVGSFHEGSPFNGIVGIKEEKPGTYIIKVKEANYILEIIPDKNKPDELIFRNNMGNSKTFTEERFRKVSNTYCGHSKYINKLLLAGTYTDAYGKIYKFSENETAIWPDRKFQYIVNLDYTFASDNYIMTYDYKSFYCFEIKGQTLSIYKGIEDKEGLGVHKDSKPLAVLKKK